MLETAPLKHYIKMTKEQIINNINSRPLIWASRLNIYIGITNDINRRLQEHNVSNYDLIGYWEADSVEDARFVEKYFLNMGMQGGAGGGLNPLWVYCYYISSHTRQ